MVSEKPSFNPQRRTTALLAVVVTLTFVGFFVGVRQNRELREHRSFAPQKPSSTAPVARSNSELIKRPWRSELAVWTPDRIPQTIPVTPHNKEAHKSALMRREDHRAFDGAPPTVPHLISAGSSAKECMACHLHGTAIGAVIAPAMSHPVFTMCTQCHVSEQSGPPKNPPSRDSRDATINAAASTGNTFSGIRSAPAPYRAAKAAPPQIPHTTFMRENCISCHGPSGKPGLQTSHPQRKACQQCHASSASVEQRQITADRSLP